MTVGGSLDEETRHTLFNAAQEIMQTKSRRVRLRKATHGLEGEVTTNYKFELMGGVGGFAFAANFDTEKRTIRTTFIARPLTDENEKQSFRWVRTPFLPEKQEVKLN